MSSFVRAARKKLQKHESSSGDEDETEEDISWKTVQLARARKGGLYDKEAAASNTIIDFIDSDADPDLSTESRSTFDTVSTASRRPRRRSTVRTEGGDASSECPGENEYGDDGDLSRTQRGMPRGAVFAACQDWRSPMQDVLEKPVVRRGDVFRKVTRTPGRSWQMMALSMPRDQEQIIEAPAHIFVKTDQDMTDQTDFYFDGMTRQQAVTELRKEHVTEGTFIIRPCETDLCNYTLSVVDKRRQVSHYKIVTTDNGTFVIKFSVQRCVEFDTLAELVSRYRQPIMPACRSRPCTKLMSPYRFNPQDMDNESLNDGVVFSKLLPD